MAVIYGSDQSLPSPLPVPPPSLSRSWLRAACTGRFETISSFIACSFLSGSPTGVPVGSAVGA
ncbi:hypothetical protein GCM10012285_49670 [Streptomyces kronopolitis]|uniref:Uncharacterized protein n=1 Tax=Streptomyces kronopolitis TaxID=1612435 RepID=A0ABQ2JSA1_9ACTN|nr:hypothetical protein GCM10012285_49670 [Streptomyces kronopolitis]